LIRKISELSGQEYTGTEDGRTDVATRVVADHARALTFAIADGAAPSNSGRGYVLRRLVSRASEFSSSALNVRGPILWKLVDVIAQSMGDVFKNVRDQQEYIEKLIREEEERFLVKMEVGKKTFNETVNREIFPAI